MNSNTDQSIFDLIGGKDRILVIVALQALHRERVNAWKTALRVADDSGLDAPSERLFGIDEPRLALERMGAAPYLG